MTTKTGRCLCGSVRFSARAVERHFTACHCGMCQRWGGGPLLSADCKEVSFEGTQHLARYRSSEWAERGFCRTCGTHLFYLYLGKSQYFIPIGAFDDPSEFQLRKEIFIDRKPAGYAFTGEHPRLTEAQAFEEFSNA